MNNQLFFKTQHHLKYVTMIYKMYMLIKMQKMTLF